MKSQIISSRRKNRYTVGPHTIFATSRLWAEVLEAFALQLKPVIEKQAEADFKRVSVVNLGSDTSTSKGTATVIVEPTVIDNIQCKKIFLPISIGELRLMTDIVAISGVPVSVAVKAQSKNIPFSDLVDLPAPICIKHGKWQYDHDFEMLKAPYDEEYARIKIMHSLL